MSETFKPRYELRPESLRKRLESIGIDYVAYAKPSTSYKDAIMLLLNASSGERVIIDKALKDSQPRGNFFQDMNMVVLPGVNPTFYAEQVDFNFNQFGDGQLRKRVVSGKENGYEAIPKNASAEGILHLTQLTLRHLTETVANMQLAQEMGVNNQPVTAADIAEAMSYLDGASVIDPNTNNPVGIV